jgi:hypothetical protein
VCTRGCNRALLCGPSTSPLDGVMSAAVLKGVFSVIAAVVLLAMWVGTYKQSRGSGAVLKLVGISSLLVVALTQVCDAFSILPSLGWGEAGSVGNYIEFASGLLGVACLVLGTVRAVR